MTYRIDPAVLLGIAGQVAAGTDDPVLRAVELLAQAYPDLIDPAPGRWVGSKAGGILGKVRFLYFSPRDAARPPSSPSSSADN